MNAIGYKPQAYHVANEYSSSVSSKEIADILQAANNELIQRDLELGEDAWSWIKRLATAGGIGLTLGGMAGLALFETLQATVVAGLAVSLISCGLVLGWNSLPAKRRARQDREAHAVETALLGADLDDEEELIRGW